MSDPSSVSDPSPRPADESPADPRRRAPNRGSGRGFLVRRIIAIVSAAVVLGAVGLGVGPIVGTWLTHDPAIPEASFIGFIWGGRIGPVVGIALGIGIGILISRRRDPAGP